MMEEYYLKTINDLRERLKEKDKVIKQLEEKLDKNQIIKELEREKSKNKKLKSALKIAKDNEEYLKKKLLLFSVFNLKENKEIIGGKQMKEYLIVYIDEKYDYVKEEARKEIKNYFVKAKNKKEALEDSQLEFSTILNIIELKKID